jgi:TonB family protein
MENFSRGGNLGIIGIQRAFNPASEPKPRGPAFLASVTIHGLGIVALAFVQAPGYKPAERAVADLPDKGGVLIYLQPRPIPWRSDAQVVRPPRVKRENSLPQFVMPSPPPVTQEPTRDASSDDPQPTPSLALADSLPKGLPEGLLAPMPTPPKPPSLPVAAGFDGPYGRSSQGGIARNNTLSASVGSFASGVDFSGGAGPSRNVHGPIRPVSLFDPTPVATPRQLPRLPKTVDTPDVEPAEINENPTPEYTDEARNLKIEGIVRVQVIFHADGWTEVVDTLQTLGHGLDEKATAVVKRIKFKPGHRNGKAVDQPAILDVVFKLAY